MLPSLETIQHCQLKENIMLSRRIKAIGWALTIAACCAASTLSYAASVSATGEFPTGTFVNDFSDIGVAEFEILWKTTQPLKLTIQFYATDGGKINLRIANVNDTKVPWSDFHLLLDDAINDDSVDDPVWNAIQDVDVIHRAVGLPYQVAPLLDTHNNNIELLFEPFIQSVTISNDPNGQLFIGAYDGRGLGEWIIDISPLISAKNPSSH